MMRRSGLELDEIAATETTTETAITADVPEGMQCDLRKV